MILEYYNGSTFVTIDPMAENLFFGNLDGYDGSIKEVIFRMRNETTDPEKNNVMLRVIEKYGTTEYPFEIVENDVKVAATGGSAQIDGKVRYSVKTDASIDASKPGTQVTPDSNGLFRLGNLAAANGEIIYAITVEVDSKILFDLGDSLKISEIFFRYFSTSK